MKKILATITLMAFATNASAGQTVRIGTINANSGNEAGIGENLTNGYAIAITDLKKRGIDVVLESEDDGGKQDKSLAAYEKLVSHGVAGIVGSYTSATASVIASRADQYKVPLLIPAAAKENITQMGYKYVFRMNAPADKYSSTLFDLVLSLDKNINSIALISESSDFGTSTVATALEQAKKLGWKVLANEKYQKGQPDFRSILTKVKALKPDLIFNVSYVADAILLMRQARELGVTPKAFLGAGAGYTTAEFMREKAISINVFASTQWTDDVNWKGAKTFFNDYKARFHKEPTYHAACAYASMIAMAESAAKANGNPQKTRDYLKAGKWDGIMGHVEFSDYDKFTNQNNHPMLVQQSQNGQYETVFPAKFASKKPVYPFVWGK